MVIDSFDWNGQQQASREWRDRISELEPEELLRRLDETGWLTAVGAERAEELRQALPSALRDNPAFCFYELADTEFDGDCIEETGTDDSCSYFSIIMQLADESRSLFQPTEVVDLFDDEAGVARISFVHDEQRYDCEVPLDGTWFQQPVLEMINRALADSGREHRFIDLPSCNQTLCLALVPEAVYTKAVELGLIPDVNFYSPSTEHSVEHSVEGGGAFGV